MQHLLSGDMLEKAGLYKTIFDVKTGMMSSTHLSIAMAGQVQQKSMSGGQANESGKYGPA